MNPMSIFTDPVVSCPYDKSHRVALSKIQKHIVKCEKSYPVGYKETCPYNATHRLFKHELQDHIRTCPQKRLIDPESYQYVGNHGSFMSDFILQSITESVLDHGESWEDREFPEDCDPSTDGDPNDSNTRSSPRRGEDPCMNLRCPRGYSEVMMMGGESDVAVSDMESVVSVMGLGRGRANSNKIQQYRRFNFGRGRSMPHSE